MAQVIDTFPTPQKDLKVLLLGAGGREHALAYKLAQSDRVASVVVSPGNGGTAKMGGKVSNLELKWGAGFEELVQWAKQEKVSLEVEYRIT